MTKLVIYADLDGSLLDHDNYSHAAADALLAELEVHGVPVIIASSKTRSEQIALRIGIIFIGRAGYRCSCVFRVCSNCTC
jgi:mannosyl-3-phosphoglycerate phosphatase